MPWSGEAHRRSASAHARGRADRRRSPEGRAARRPCRRDWRTGSPPISRACSIRWCRCETRPRQGRFREASTLPGPARGLAFQLAEALGAIERHSPALPHDVRGAAQALRPFGVRVGWQSVYLPRLIKPAPAALSALLWAIHAKLDRIPPPPQPGLTSFALNKNDEFEVPDGFLAAAFYRRLGTRAVRLDILERMETVLADAAKRQEERRRGHDRAGFPARLWSCGCARASQRARLAPAGARGRKTARQRACSRSGERARHARIAKAPACAHSPSSSDSPFALLADLIDVD